MPCRVQAYIKNGWADALIDPDGTITGTDISSSNPTNDDAIFPKDLSWNNIKTYYKSPSEVPKFTNADIVTYFVMRKVCDGSSCTDFKSINQSAIDLFHCGHLQQVEIAESNATLWIQANCLPQMRKDRTYKVVLSLLSLRFQIFGILLLTTSRGGQSGISFTFRNKKLIYVAKILETVAHDNPNLSAVSCSNNPSRSLTNTRKNSSNGAKARGRPFCLCTQVL